MKNNIFSIRKLAAGLLLFAAMLFAGFGMQTVEAADETAAANIYIENICVEGKTEEELYQVIQDKLDELGLGAVTINVGEQSTVAALKDLGLYCLNSDEIVSKILSMGNKGNIWQKYKMEKYLDNSEPIIFEMDLAVDEDLVRSVVETKCQALNIARQDMQLQMGSDGKLYPTDKVDGLYVNVDETTTVVTDYLDHDWFGGYGEIDAITEDDPAAGDEETYSQVNDVLGQGATVYDVDEEHASRDVNLQVGTEKINGTIVYPGEEFSALEVLSPFTAENGYTQANVILNGEMVDDFGGGLCQVTSTLYRAVLEAELCVTERCEHSLMVGYVEPSMDASISEGSKDFKFVNDSDAPIYIEGTCADGVLQFTIYGHETREEGRTLEFVGETVSETEYDERIEFDSSEPYGYIDEQTGRNGANAVAYKYVYQDGELVSNEAITYSYYKVVDHVYTVGIAGATDAQMAKLEQYQETNDFQSLIIMLGAY